MKRHVVWLLVVILLAAWLAYATRWQVSPESDGLLVRTNRYTGATAYYIPKRGWVPDGAVASDPRDPFGILQK